MLQKTVAAKFNASQAQVSRISKSKKKRSWKGIRTILIHQESVAVEVLKKMWKRCCCAGLFKPKVEGF